MLSFPTLRQMLKMTSTRQYSNQQVGQLVHSKQIDKRSIIPWYANRQGGQIVPWKANQSTGNIMQIHKLINFSLHANQQTGQLVSWCGN